MKLQTLVQILALWLCCLGCKHSISLEKLDSNQINTIMKQVNENDPLFTQKNVPFDSIITYAGVRTTHDGVTERVKMKIYYYGPHSRGYYNLTNRDDKNLQVFGKKVNDLWAFKSVTKLNMEEVGGYLIWKDPKHGIWSNGHYSFKIGTLEIKKQNIDYNDLTSW